MLAAAALAWTAAAAADEPGELLRTPLAELYGMPAELGAVKLSPDGSLAVAIRWSADGASEVVVDDFSDREPAVVARRTAAEPRLESCEWKSDTRLLCVTRAHNAVLTRLLSVNLEGPTTQVLQEFGSILDMLPNDARRVAFRRDWIRLGENLGEIGKLDIDTGRFDRSMEGIARTWLTDADGMPRVYDDDRNGWVVLPAPGANWLLLREWEREGNYLRPIAFDSQTNEVICLDVLDGRSALFAIAAADLSTRLLYADPFGHVVDAGPVGKQEGLGWVAIFDGQYRYEPLVARVASVRDAIQRSFSFDTVEIHEEDANGRYYLAFVGARGVGAYYRYDSVERRLDKIGDTHASLAERRTARGTQVQFQSGDGRTTAARVTLTPLGGSPPTDWRESSSTTTERKKR